jgi:tyrosyl-tRNA synthetase
MKQSNNSYFRIQRSELGELQGLADLLQKHGLAKSKAEVRREIEKGGLYLNNKKL